jgi:beta-hydroxylase
MFLSTDNPEFKHLKCLEENYMKIKDEIPVFDKSTINIKRESNDSYDNNARKLLIEKIGNNRNWIQGYVDIWYNYPLMAHNVVIGDAEKLCPLTIKLLKEIGGIKIAGFSLLLPNSKLPVHCDSVGPTFNSMAYNMKLVGGICNLHIKIDNKFISHRHITGKPVIFNSEIFHYADNKGTTNRIILYVDFENKN